jgi:methionyl aminopeptidase
MFNERRVTLKSRAQVEKMAVAGALVADVLDRMAAEVKEGVATIDLDRMAEEMIRAAGGIPSFIGVPGRLAPFKHSLCISINDEVVHGIPGPRRIRAGDIVSIDAGAIVDGWHGDAARSFLVGEVTEAARTLVEATREAMYAGIAAARVGNHLGDISAAIEDVARPHGYGIVRSFVGHGIGTEMHEEPQVTNYRSGSRGRRLEAGLCLAIEPMFTLGTHEVRVKSDGWTVATADGSLAAHWENTIAITSDGPRILTEHGVSPASTEQSPAKAGGAPSELAAAGQVVLP